MLKDLDFSVPFILSSKFQEVFFNQLITDCNVSLYFSYTGKYILVLIARTVVGTSHDYGLFLLSGDRITYFRSIFE